MNGLAIERQVWKTHLSGQGIVPSLSFALEETRLGKQQRQSHSHLEVKRQPIHEMALQRGPKRKQKALDLIPCFSLYTEHAEAAM